MRIAHTVIAAAVLAGLPWPAAADVGPAAAPPSVAAAKAAMMSQPDLALSHARAAKAALSAAQRGTLSEAETLWLEAEALSYLQRIGEAKPVLEQARVIAARHSPPGKLHGDILRSRAALAASEGRTGDALIDLQAAYAIFIAAREPRSQAVTLLDLGAIHGEAGDPRRALRYYEQAAEAYDADPAITLAIENGRGTEWKALGDLRQAADAYRAALTQARAMDSPMLVARILTNLASVEFAAGRLTAADRLAVEGLRAARSADAAAWRPHLWGVRAQVAFARGDAAGAERLIARTFAGQDLTRTTVDFRDFHAAAERILAARGKPGQALEHLRAVKRIDDETKAVVASAAAALASARFDYARQDLRIAKLRAEALKRDVALARSRERVQRTTFGAALAVALAILGGVLLALRSARRGRDQVAAVNKDLSRANIQLDRALKAKSEFLATTSHEIRTPLNGILGMTEVMLHDPAASPEQRERAQLVHGAGETMKALVDDLLDVAKMESGTVELQAEDVDIRRLLADVVALWTPQAEAKGLTLSAELDRLPERVIGHGRHLRQIAFNLMSNAVKFTLSGSIAVTARVEAGEGGERLLLEVADTGIGIPESDLEAIFEPFHQVDGGTTRQFGGTGLGLSICRNYSRAMKGDVSVESVLGEGSTFRLCVPVEVVALAAPAVAARPATLADAELLVLEPNPLKRSIIEAAVGGSVAALRFGATLDELRAMAAERPAAIVVAPEADLARVDAAVAVALPANPMGMTSALAQALADGAGSSARLAA